MISVDELRKMLREACEAAGSQKAWAAKNGVSTAYVSDVLAGRRDPGEGISKAFGLKPITVYVSAHQPTKASRRGTRDEVGAHCDSRRQPYRDRDGL